MSQDRPEDDHQGDDRHRDTDLVHVGRDPMAHRGVVNTPVYHASTILFPSLAEYEGRTDDRQTFTYGRLGTPTSAAFEEAVAELEGAVGAVSMSSGLAAITTCLTAFLRAGDHLLMVDSTYGPTRRFCDRILARFGVETTYYDPTIGAEIETLIRDTTRVIFLESPGSLTFEIQDVPAITAVARRRDILTMMDNTWASPLLFKPLDHGVTIAIEAATKYLCGHADVMMGICACADEDTLRTLKTTTIMLGQAAGPDDLYMALRGIRTLGVRMRQHEASALQVASWLRDRPEVERVLYPALPDDPGHALWKRDFNGASGLFGVLLKPVSEKSLDAMVDGLQLFPIGESWGGYESLILPSHPERNRSATAWTAPGTLLRLHIGLEDPVDLINDLAKGFERLHGTH